MQDETSASATGSASWPAALARAFAEVDRTAWVAVVLLFSGWFLLSTVNVDLSPFAPRSLRFFDLPSVIETPSRLFTGVKHRGAGTAWFVLLCCVTLLTPTMPCLWRQRRAWLAMIAPSVLILICILLIYARASGGESPAAGADTIASDLRHLGHHVIDGARNGMGRRITLGAGAYVAAMSSLYLAVLGIRGYRNHRL